MPPPPVRIRLYPRAGSPFYWFDIRPPLVTRRIRRSTGETDHARAMDVARAALEKLAKPDTPLADLTLGHVLESWLTSRALELPESTVAEYRQRGQRALAALGSVHLGGKVLGDVPSLARARDAILARGGSRSLQRSTIWALCQLVRHARRRGVIARMPEELPVLPRNPSDDERAEALRLLTPAEDAKILSELAWAPHWHSCWRFIRSSGQRPMQVLSLLPEDIVGDVATMRAGARGNKRRNRYTIRLGPEALRAVADVVAWKQTAKKSDGSRWSFRPNKGGPPERLWPFEVRALQNAVTHAARRAGVDASAYDLRHTLAIRAREAGASIEAIGKQLGHRSTRSTEVYAKRVPGRPSDLTWLEVSETGGPVLALAPRPRRGTPYGG